MLGRGGGGGGGGAGEIQSVWLAVTVNLLVIRKLNHLSFPCHQQQQQQQQAYRGH